MEQFVLAYIQFLIIASVLIYASHVVLRRIFRRESLDYVRLQGGVWLGEDWDFSRRFDQRFCSVTYSDKHGSVRRVKAIYLPAEQRYEFLDDQLLIDTAEPKVPGSLDPIELDRKRLQRELAKLEAMAALKKRNAAKAAAKKVIKPVYRKPGE